MLELAEDLLPFVREGTAVAIVTVTRVARSAPRGVGAAMAVTAGGTVIGSISGGCVEGDCVMLAHAVLGDGEARTARFGFSDETAHAAGLACGGSVDVLAFALRAGHLPLLERAASGRAVSVGIVASGPLCGLVVEDPERFAPAAVAAREDLMLESAYVGADGATESLVVLSRAPRPRLIVVGSGEHAAALCRLGTAIGYAVTVCDAWELLVTAARFPDAAELVAAMPHEYLGSLTPEDIDERTAVCVLTHDERLDVPALRVALELPVGFVGAMGARSTVERRATLLRQAGVPETALARLHSPLGLDLGGSSPEETALSVLAEITAARHGGTGRPLRLGEGPLHRRTGAATGAAAEASSSCSPAVAVDIPW